MKNKIYFVCPTNKSISGGIKQIYRQVEVLNKNGFNAVVLLKNHIKEKWFESNVPIESNPYLFKKIKYSYKNKSINFWRNLVLKYLRLKSKTFEKDSILVFPEIYGPRICEIEPEIKKVIFNQNCYYTFEHFQLDENLSKIPYNQNILATICVSEDSEKYLKFAFPNLPVYRIHLGIDNKVFKYSAEKKRQIAFMPRKLSEDVVQVINILRNRGRLESWDFVAIDNKTEIEVAKILRESAIFLSFNHKEGFGLPPVEAMSCGCYVIGYAGEAGKEYLKPEFSSLIPDGNIVKFVEAVEKTIDLFETNPMVIIDKGKKGSDFANENYNLKREDANITSVWKNILN